MTDTPWWWAVVGLIAGGFCFWIKPAAMTGYPMVDKSIMILVGLLFLGLFTLAIRRTTINFDRPADSVTRTTKPLLPLGNIKIFRLRSETRPIKPILFAYLELQKKSNADAKPSYCLALATGLIPDEILKHESAHIFEPEMEKVRWLVGHNAAMKKKNADEIVTAVNLWLGTK